MNLKSKPKNPIREKQKKIARFAAYISTPEYVGDTLFLPHSRGRRYYKRFFKQATKSEQRMLRDSDAEIVCYELELLVTMFTVNEDMVDMGIQNLVALYSNYIDSDQWKLAEEQHKVSKILGFV